MNECVVESQIIRREFTLHFLIGKRRNPYIKGIA